RALVTRRDTGLSRQVNSRKRIPIKFMARTSKGRRIPPAVPFHFPRDLLGPVPSGHPLLLLHADSSFSSHPVARNTAVPVPYSHAFHRQPVYTLPPSSAV